MELNGTEDCLEYWVSVIKQLHPEIVRYSRILYQKYRLFIVRSNVRMKVDTVATDYAVHILANS
jgi:hypothetical protein